MFATATGTATNNPAYRYIQQKQESSLARMLDELASLRYTVILAARWGSSTAPGKGGRRELECQRILYSDKIDEIAMNFGIQKAMNAQEKVEREVTVAKGLMFFGKQQQA